MRKIEHSTL